jgi:hypothetical protein
MTALRFLPVVGFSIFLSSCATPPPPVPVGPPPVLAKLQAMGVKNSTYKKIANHRVLNYSDILGLLNKGVKSPVILTYIKSTKAPYTITDAELNTLNNAGASAALLNYLGKSVGFFEATERNQTGGAGKWKDDPYFADPYFMGEPPFAYGWPGEWYDPGFVDAMF